MVRPGPGYSVLDVHRGWVTGLEEHDVDVVEFTLDWLLEVYLTAQMPDGQGGLKHPFDLEQAVRLTYKHLEALCYECWPDAVVFTTGIYLDAFTVDLLNVRTPQTVLLCTESPYEDDRQITQGQRFDHVLLNDPTHIDDFRAACKNVLYTPHAHDPDVHSPGRPLDELVCDVAFTGTGYPSRIEFLEAVDWTDVDLRLAGNWEHLPEGSTLRDRVIHALHDCWENADAVDLYRSARSSLNLYRRESNDGMTAEGWSMGPREVELAATGTFYLTEARGENREVLPMVPTFDGPGDYRAKRDWWLAHEDARDEVTRKAREAIAPRTFEANAQLLLEQLEH